MRLMLVHHADAVGPHVDPQRPLSTLGHEQARDLAVRAKATGFVPAAIWHSGKLRARQTAEPFLQLNPFAEFKMIRGISPDDAPELLLESLAHESRDLIVVSHMPYLPALLERLSPESRMFPMNGYVLLERDGGGWREVARSEGGAGL
jgi:phosphohistidine phosphatase